MRHPATRASREAARSPGDGTNKQLEIRAYRYDFEPHAALYTPAGLASLAAHLHPGGVFALWSNDPPDAAFEQLLAGAFATSAAHVLTFDNSFGEHDASNTVYVAVTADLPIPEAIAGAHRPPV